MKYYVLLVTAFLATTLAQLSTGDFAIARCDTLGERECGAELTIREFNCTWCPELSRCRAKVLGCTCKECPLTLKIAKTCADGSLLPQKCNLDKCTWVSEECPSGSPNATCTCSNSLQSSTRQCPDGTIVSPTCLVEKNCTWIYPTCSSCDGCNKAAFPENSVTRQCPDGSSTKPICDDVKCEWFVPSCPSNESHSICPAGVPVVQCIMSPCASVRTNTDYNPEAVTCKEDYCGGCNARCYNTAGNEVECVRRREIDCSVESNCPAEKPSVEECKTNAKVYCAPSYTKVNGGPACNWNVYCPPADPTTIVCNERSCGNNTLSMIALCRNGQKPNWYCEKVQLTYASDTASSVIAECSWVSRCPPILEDDKKCVVGGACGDQCKLPEVSILPALNAELCRKNLTCEQQCSISHRISGSCSHRDGFGCQFSYQDGYYDCLKKCAGQQIEQPVCSGSACDCDYSKCYLCVLSLTLDSGRTLSKGVCASQTYGDACSAFGGSAAYAKPEKCLVIDQTGTAVPTEVAGVVKTIRDTVNTNKIQEKINQVIDSIPETKDLLIAATFTTDPQVTAEKEVSYDVVLSITGASDLTTQQKLAICEKIVKPALESTISGINKRLICNLEKVKSGSVKRGLLSSTTSSYSANVVTAQAQTTPTGGNDTPNDGSAAGTIVFSIFVAIVALLALIVF